jgi:hypothetical protein
VKLNDLPIPQRTIVLQAMHHRKALQIINRAPRDGRTKSPPMIRARGRVGSAGNDIATASVAFGRFRCVRVNVPPFHKIVVPIVPSACVLVETADHRCTVSSPGLGGAPMVVGQAQA